jgi:hypothetical protein
VTASWNASIASCVRPGSTSYRATLANILGTLIGIGVY